MSSLVVVGDTFLDRDLAGRASRLSPEAPVPVVEDVEERIRPGGAALTATMLAREGHAVTLVTALGADRAGELARARLAAVGVAVIASPQSRTEEKVRVHADGVPITRVDFGTAAAAPVSVPAGAGDAIAAADAVVVSDYGRGVADRIARAGLLGPGHAPTVWDPHPRGPAPVRGTMLATPNAAEAGLGRAAGLPAAVDAGRRLRRDWCVAAVAVTRGRAGAVLVTDDDARPDVVPSEAGHGAPCGAGDAFAAAAAVALATGSVLSDAVVAAVASATRFVGGGGVAALTAPGIPDGHPLGDRAAESPHLVRPVVVAAVGVFDGLHAGHVTLLQQARALGDRLVVVLNSDRSVAAWGGRATPAHDRAAVLRALACVDDVVLFDDASPVATLRALQPEIVVKGGDWTRPTEEAAAARSWGGRAVTIPYVARPSAMAARSVADAGT
ncbi:MAG: PfkB family carbohydrate kinase [Acidimicrobiia bacterium]